jgi:prolyl oligopeptidase
MVPWIYCLDATSNDCIINVLSWKQPLIRYDFNALSHQTTISTFNTSPKYPGTDDLIIEEIEVKGHDGVMIPLSLFYNKKIKKDGKNIVYMTGYGSYGNVVPQSFNLLFLPLLNKGVILHNTSRGGEKGL